jgi:antirestriction protein ArdC
MKNSTEKFDIYQTITDKFLESLEQGVIPWQKPWRSAAPMNLVSKKTYSGINVLLLGMTKYASPYWVSYKQATELGGHVKKGEKSHMVVFWKFLNVTDKNNPDESKKIPMLRYYMVFNVEQCEGLEKKIPTVESLAFNPLEECEKIVDGYKGKPEIEEGGDSASYSPSLDRINMPHKEKFKSVDGYYSTIFHEMIHSTGHAKRLNRNEVVNNDGFGNHSYSKEELCAEIGAAILSSMGGVESTFDNSTAYLQSWLKSLQNDKKMIIYAAQRSQKAVDHILGIVKEEKPE